MSKVICLKEPFALLLAGSSLAVGLALTVWGLAQMDWPQALPWGQGAFVRYIGLLLVGTVTVVAASRWSGRSPLLIGLGVAVAFAILAGALWSLIVVAWFALAASFLGRFVLLRSRIGLGDDWLTNFLVGAGVYGTAVGLLAHFPVSYSGAYGVALVIPVILGWRVIAEKSSSFFARVFEKNSEGLRYTGWLDVGIAVVALVYFVVALMPEVGHDALAMHLFIPAHLSMRHQWGFDANTYVWAVMPMLGDWVFAIGYILGGEASARLVNVGFIFALGWLVRDLVIWAGGSARGARWAILIYLSTPLTFTESSSLFIESVWACFVIAGALAVLRSCSTSGKAGYELPVAGICFGLAVAAKSVTLSILPVLLLLLVWRLKKWRTVGVQRVALGLSLFVVIGFIPYVTAWWLTGNPVFPFFNAVFRSNFYPAVNFDSASIFGSGLTWDVLYRATFETGKYLEAKAGASGFQLLILIVPAAVTLVATSTRRGVALLVVGTLVVAAIFQSVSYLRYIFPAYAILIAAIGVALSVECAGSAFKKNCGYFAVGTVVVLNLLFLNAGAQYGDFALGSVLDETSRQQYLLGRLPHRNAVELVNNLNSGHAPVAVFSPPYTAGLAADALYSSWYNNVFQAEISSTKTEEDIADALIARGVVFVILDANWKGGAEKLELIKKVTKSIAEYGSVSVRRITTEHQFRTELLTNPNFTSIDGWALVEGARYDAITGYITVTVASPAVQQVAVSAGRKYLHTVVARCAKDAARAVGRIQINWTDINGKYVSTDIRTFECSSDWTEHTQEVTAPPNSGFAVVYAAGHTSAQVEFKSNSLRR